MSDNIDRNKNLMEELNKPFNINEVEWRVQGAKADNNGFKVLVVPYLNARTIMKRLDTACNFLWQTQVVHIDSKGFQAFQCQLSIKIGDEWVTRTDAAEASDIEPIKGGYSNALKRAGVQWGVGRYLYDLPTYWVPLKDRGHHNVFGNFKVGNEKKFLKGYFDTPTLPNWALPAGTSQKQTAPSTKQQTQGNQSSGQQQRQEQNTSKQNPIVQPNQNGHVKRGECIGLVKTMLESLQVPQNFIPGLLKKVNNVKVPYTQATTKQMGEFYHALLVVHTYVTKCREYGLDDERLLYYAQIPLKVKLKSIYSLVGVMSKENCTYTLGLIREDLNDSQKQVG